jgi:FAD/FMN-containing dehydrogenase
VRQLNRDLYAILLDLGFLHYKAPDWAVEEMSGRAHPGFVELFDRVRRTLDPNGIMNPGRQGWNGGQ